MLPSEAAKRLKRITEKFGFTPETKAKDLKGSSFEVARNFGQYQVLSLLCPQTGVKKEPVGYVYLARKSVTSVWKVGSSLVPEKRVQEVQVGNDFPMHLTHKIEFATVAAAKQAERELKLHLRARKRNTRGPHGEWFHLDTDEALSLKKALSEGAFPSTVILKKGRYV